VLFRGVIVVVDRLLELMSLLGDVNRMLLYMAKLAQGHGVKVYVIGGCVEFSEHFKCYEDMCVLNGQDSCLRVHADGSIDKVLKTTESAEIVETSRGEFEEAVAQYKDRVEEAVKSLRELREVLKAVTAAIELVS
jgi:redox-sensitive bicupin YhaK (pirin superfamily)